jgi:hypothetical protein
MTQEDNIKVDLKQTQHECVGWIQVVWVTVKWQSLVNMVTELQIMYMGKPEEPADYCRSQFYATD